MKNFFGDEVNPEDLILSFEDCWPHMNIFRGKNKEFVGQVSPNGWNEFNIFIAHEKGEPILQNLKGTFSLAEMSQIIAQWQWMNLNHDLKSEKS